MQMGSVMGSSALDKIVHKMPFRKKEKEFIEEVSFPTLQSEFKYKTNTEDKKNIAWSPELTRATIKI